MTEPKKISAVQFITQIESVRLANWLIRTAWKMSAGMIAVTARLVTTIILAVLRLVQRNRRNW